MSSLGQCFWRADRQYGRPVPYSDGVTFSLRAAVLALVIALVGAACSGGSDSTDTAASGGADTPTADQPADDGDAADAPADDTASGSGSDASDADTAVSWEHDWTGALIGGGQLDANDLAGQDVVLWFWAPW